MRFLSAVLLVSVAFGCGEETITKTESKPVAKFTLNQSSVRPQVVRVDASDSFTAVGTISKYVWQFGDTTTETTGPTALHAFKNAGTYKVTLTVLDEQETPSDAVSEEVSVNSVNTELPKAKIAGPTTTSTNTTVTFDGGESTPASDIVTFAWNFGDPASNANNTFSGDAKTAKGASHVFQAGGQYKVTLTVTDSLNQSDTTELLLAVGGGNGPVAVCSYNPTQPLQGAPVTFDGNGSIPAQGTTIKAWLWDFDDGNKDVPGATVKHTYNVQASFTPRLTVIDSKNQVGEATCQPFTVGVPPLCSSEYTLEVPTNERTQSCSGTNVTWGGVKMHIAQTGDGKIKGTEQFQNQTLIFDGTWSGVDFTMTGKFTEPDGWGGTVTTTMLVQGKFSGCSQWVGTWTETKKHSSGATLCSNLKWNVTGNRL